MQSTFAKISSAPTVGQYTPTAVDTDKAASDFRLIQVSPYVIDWRDGTREKVTARRLAKLQASHAWAADF